MSLVTWVRNMIPSRPLRETGTGDLTAEELRRVAGAERPGLNPIDMVNFGFMQPVLRNAYNLSDNCSLLADIAQTLTQETVRAGISVVPKFMRKCINCGHEMLDRRERCESCGSTSLREPSHAQHILLKRPDGYTWEERVNDNAQTLSELITQADIHLNTCDNAYIFAIKDYLFYELGDEIPEGKEVGDVSDAFVREFITLDPRFTEKVFDHSGRLGGQGRICLKHRREMLPDNVTRCPKCGKKTHDVAARYYASTDSLAYFTADEFIHLTKYYPHPLYGTPPAFKLGMNVLAYIYIEARIKNYYEKGRPPGLIAIATDNPMAIDENIRKINEQQQRDPATLPWMPVSTGQSRVGKAVEYIPFMQDPSNEMMTVKNEIRRAICSFFNVSPIFMSDTEGAGGLNNEGHQITILNRAIEKGQSVYNDKFFVWMMKNLHITDWRYHLNKSEQADEKDTAELQILLDQHALNLQAMGFNVWTHEGKYKHNDYPENPPMKNTTLAGVTPVVEQSHMKRKSGQDDGGVPSGG